MAFTCARLTSIIRAGICNWREAQGSGRLNKRHRGMEQDIQTECAVRLGLRQIKGFSKEDAERIEATRGKGFDSVSDMRRRTGLGYAALEKLANADAFGSLGLSRRDALWAVQGLDKVKGDELLPLFAHHSSLQNEAETHLPSMPLGEEVAYDYKTIKLSLKKHPVAFLRPWLCHNGYVLNEHLREMRNGARVLVSGLVLVRQRPGTASGVIFATLEDESSVANIIVWPKTFERFRRDLLGARFLGVEGRLQREGEVIHIIAYRPLQSDPQAYNAKLAS